MKVQEPVLVPASTTSNGIGTSTSTTCARSKRKTCFSFFYLHIHFHWFFSIFFYRRVLILFDDPIFRVKNLSLVINTCTCNLFIPPSFPPHRFVRLPNNRIPYHPQKSLFLDPSIIKVSRKKTKGS